MIKRKIDVPTWVRWVAVDEYGNVCGFKYKPELGMLCGGVGWKTGCQNTKIVLGEAKRCNGWKHSDRRYRNVEQVEEMLG